MVVEHSPHQVRQIYIESCRHHHALICHSYTQIETGDRVTVVVSPKSLEEVLLKFGD